MPNSTPPDAFQTVADLLVVAGYLTPAEHAQALAEGDDEAFVEAFMRAATRPSDTTRAASLRALVGDGTFAG